jgi:predicted RNA-binding protein YlqC (UPF0109 family)
LKDLIAFIAKSLVDKPDEVEVEDFDEDGTTVYELTVAEDDLGKVIGKQGRTARAMRQLLQAASSKEHKRAVLEILE